MSETAPINTTVGTLSLTPGTTGTPVYSLVDSAGGKFNILGTALRTNALLDYETATSHTITIAVSGVTPSVPNRTLPIVVINVVGPAAPVLDLITDETDTTPDLTLTGDLVVGDTVRFQYSTSAVFSGASELTNTIDAAEDTANAITFTTGALAAATWYFRARIERASEASDWSNVETITLVAPSGSPEVTQFLARTSGLDSTHIAAYTALIDGLVADGIWAKIDALYIFATQTSGNALVNLKSSSYLATISGSLTHTADDGYTMAGGSNYVNTGFNASTAGAGYQQNNAHMSVWMFNNNGSMGGTVGTISGSTSSIFCQTSAALRIGA